MAGWLKKHNLYKNLLRNLSEETNEETSGAGFPDQDLEQEDYTPKKNTKTIEVSVRADKGQREKFYKALKTLDSAGKPVAYMLDERVGTIAAPEEQVDDIIMALDDVGLIDHGVYDEPFDPSTIGK